MIGLKVLSSMAALVTQQVIDKKTCHSAHIAMTSKYTEVRYPLISRIEVILKTPTYKKIIPPVIVYFINETSL